MQPPEATTDYAHGQMMGMLVIIRLLENSIEENSPIPDQMLQTIKDVATRDLAQYLDKPEEDVLLLIDEELRSL